MNIVCCAFVLFSMENSESQIFPDKVDAFESLIAAEMAFAQMARERGIKPAFLAALGEDSVLFRPHAVDGKTWFQEQPDTKAGLIWRPAFADVSRAGDLGYTTGPWDFRPDGVDAEPIAFGSFVSIWRRVPGGPWKLIFDAGTSHPEGAYDDAPPIRGTIEHLERLPQDRVRKMNAIEKAYIDCLGRRGGNPRAFLSEGVRIYRDQTHPFGKKTFVRKLSEKPSMPRTWSTLDIFLAGSGDLACVYGAYRLPENKKTGPDGYYLHIWRLEQDGKWRVVLDLLFNVENEV